MTATLDLSRFTARLAAVRAALPVVVEARLPLAALGLIEESGYAQASADEAGTVEPITLLTEVITTGSRSSIGILQLYDWVIDPDSSHCEGNGGINCPDLADGGPYTAEQMTVRPRDGSTPCGAKCNCEFVAREPIFDATAAFGELGLGVRSDLKAAWEA